MHSDQERLLESELHRFRAIQLGHRDDTGASPLIGLPRTLCVLCILGVLCVVFINELTPR
jgi:hypothetical protein